MLLFIQLLVTMLGGLAVSYFVGTLLFYIIKLSLEELFFDCFLRLVSGIVTLTAGYAIIRTQGATILLPVLLLVLGTVYSLRRRVAAPYRLQLVTPVLWQVLAISIVVFVVQYVLLYEPGSPFLQTPFQDYVYYSRLTLPLNGLGLETNSLEIVYPQFQTEQPYHYLEIWLNALLVHLTGLPSVWVFFVSTASVLITICGVGFAAVYRHCGLRVRWSAPLGLATLTATGTVWPFLTKYLFVANGSLLTHLPLAVNPKLAPVYIVLLLVTLLLLRARFVAAGLAVAAVPLVFVATAPAIGFGVAGMAAYLGLRRRLTLAEGIGLVAPIVVALLYMGAFYALQPAPYQFPVAGRASMLTVFVPKVGELKTVLNIGAGVLLNYGIYFLGYALLALWLLWQRGRLGAVRGADQPVVAWFVATLAGATLMRAVGYHFLDGFQFFSNPMIPLTAIVLAVVLGRALYGAARTWPAVATGTLVGLLLVGTSSDASQNTRFSAEFLARVGPILHQLPNRGGYLMADSEYENAYMMSSDSYTSGTYVSNFKNDYSLVSLSALVPDSLNSDPRFARDSVQARLIKGRTTLYRLAKLRRMDKRSVCADSLPLLLTQQARLAFICGSAKAKLPLSLHSLVRASYCDSYSGEILYVLKTGGVDKQVATH